MAVLIRDRAFWVALGVGIVCTLLVAADRRRRLQVGTASVATVSTVAGLVATGRGSASLVGALALLAAGAWLTAGRAVAWQLGAAAPGAIALAAAIPADVIPTWVRVAGGGVTVVLSPLVCELDRRHPRLTGVLAAVSAFGVFGTTPDTEHARALAGGALGAAPGSADPRAVPGRAGAASLGGLVAWTVAVDGWARPGAVVGGFACVGVLALAPVLAWARPPTSAVLAVHLAVVAIASRVAGLEHAARSALVIAVVAYAGGIVVLRLAGARARGRRPPHPRE